MVRCSLYRNYFFSTLFMLVAACCTNVAKATNYTVSDKTTLQNRMNAALPGDTIIVANGTYNWGQIIFTNNNSTSASAWIVLKAQTFRGVYFTGSTYLQFKGTRVMVDGFCFANGSAGTNPVISFRSSSSALSSYCRITNILIDNYNTYSADSSTENEWVALYGTNNRVDHCTFINKYNARATVVVWYSSTTYPAPANSTYHRIDSNYFRGRSYLGANGGETIRVGDSNSSRTDGFNVIEYNLFEGLIQTEPEIISNKSDFNTYRYNTFKNCKGGLTLRHGRYCSVYGNFFIVDDATVTSAYAIRVIDKGHMVFNNYIEGVNGNSSGGTSQLRAPINLYNGVSSDSTDINYASKYFPADSCIVAFNTIVDAKGGGGIVLGGTDGGMIQPRGIVVANNLVKMATGTAVYLNPSNTALTYSCEGNIYQAPSGAGIINAGWSAATLNFGARDNNMLVAPALVTDAGVNTTTYSTMLQSADARSRLRSTVFDVGAEELNGTGSSITRPLDSTLVGAGKPVAGVLPVSILQFTAQYNPGGVVQLNWSVVNAHEADRYEVEWMWNSVQPRVIAAVAANNASAYHVIHPHPIAGVNQYRIRIVHKDGHVAYSEWVRVQVLTSNVTVTPNPANRNFYVQVAATANGTARLYNAAGTLMLQQNFSSPTFSISVHSLPEGNYVLQLVDRSQTISAYPIMIAR